MFTLPTLDLDDIPMAIDSLGHLTFCEPNKEAICASFSLNILASDEGYWEIEDIHLGTQRLSKPVLTHFIQQFEEHKSGVIKEHVANHLGDAKDQDAFDAAQSLRRAG